MLLQTDYSGNYASILDASLHMCTTRGPESECMFRVLLQVRCEQSSTWEKRPIHSFQISIACPSYFQRANARSRGSYTVDLMLRETAFFLSLALVGWTRCSTSLPVFCTKLLQMHTLIPEVKPRPMKPSVCSVCTCQCGYMIYNTRTFPIAEFAAQQYLIPRLSLLHTASDESWNLKMRLCASPKHIYCIQANLADLCVWCSWLLTL